jgi:hypothetical protein
VRAAAGRSAERPRDRRAEATRLVVGVIDRHPGDGARIAVEPVHEQRRLPVAGRSDDQGERDVGRLLEPAEQPLAP